MRVCVLTAHARACVVVGGLLEVGGGSMRFCKLCKRRAGSRERAFFLLEDYTHCHTHTHTHTHAERTDVQHAINSFHVIFCGPKLFLQEAVETSHHGRRYEELCRCSERGKEAEWMRGFSSSGIVFFTLSLPFLRGWVVVYSVKCGAVWGKACLCWCGGRMEVWEAGSQQLSALSEAGDKQERAAAWALLPIRASQVDHKQPFTAIHNF